MLMDPIPPGGLSAMDHMAPTGNHGGHTNGLHHHHGHVEHVDEMEDREVHILVLYLQRVLPISLQVIHRQCFPCVNLVPFYKFHKRP